jgi:RNA polymerase sigma-70 factor, ECF subfamily
VLLLRDVVGLSGEETAAILDTSVPAANSALQRARATLQRQQGDGLATVSVRIDTRAQALLERYSRAWEAADVEALIGLLASDARWSMPPWPEWYVGRDAIADFLRWAWRWGGGRLIPTAANAQPAFGYYRRADDGWRPFAIQVLSLRGDEVAAITNFVEPALFASFGLPRQLPP